MARRFPERAATRNFSRSAEERNVTQSAFSRRIQALETWLGVALIDRSAYPTTLTDAGQRFRETAEEVSRMLHDRREDLRSRARPERGLISIAALHTLSLTFFPRWFRSVESRLGPLGSRLLPDDCHACLQAIVEGGYDFLLTFHHPAVAAQLDPAVFPYLVVGADSLVAAHSPGLAG